MKFRMKLFNLRKIRLFILFFLFKNICCNNKTSSSRADYPPYITMKNAEDCFAEYNADDTTQKYLYYCPAENHEHLKISENLCPHEQCLFLKHTTDNYDETVRCEYEIIPMTRLTLDESKTCRELSSFPVDIFFGIVVEVPKPTTENTNVVWSTVMKITSAAQECVRNVLGSSQLGSEFRQPLLMPLETAEGDIEQGTSADTEKWYQVQEMYAFHICFNHHTLQPDYAMHILRYSSLRAEISSSHTPITEEDFRRFRNDYYDVIDLQSTYQFNNRYVDRKVSQNLATVVPQLLISPQDQMFKVLENSTFFNINVAPMLSEVADIWHNINRFLDAASRKWEKDLIIYTGNIRTIVQNDKQHTPFYFIYKLVSPKKTYTEIPKVWYKLVGTLNSNDSLGIVLINGSHIRETIIKLKHKCMNTVETGRWKDVFNGYSNDNILFCNISKPITKNENNMENLKLFDNKLDNPSSLIKVTMGGSPSQWY